MHPKLIKFLLVFFSLMPTWALALASDGEQLINIEADHAQLDNENKVTQYQGNAILTQGTLRITGDVITFYYDDNKHITKAVAKGDFAKYQQIYKLEEYPIKARALQMEYHAQVQKIYLLGKGHILKQGNKFSGNSIAYDISNNIIQANAFPVRIKNKIQSSAGKVHIVIQPADDNRGK
ncbi:MAG: lipopolysaccharide transport periplasmic protein LptA [Piscirickettsiaceae bacterium]|nr:lipopolysaccharide transport periplasmic protein LptA [Piscirickettsiaceae bacterium]